jgi:hypothetical protein
VIVAAAGGAVVSVSREVWGVQGVLLAAVVVLTVLVVLDLALSLAIVRRLREERTERREFVDPHLAQLVGRPVPERPEAERLREGAWFVAFVAAGCSACHDQLPQLREHLAARKAAGEPALVVVGDAPEGGGELAAAAGDAEVVVQADLALSEAFGVDAYPTYLDVEDGLVVQVYLSIAAVPAPALA